MICRPGSVPQEWMPINRPPGPSARASGATTFEALNCVLARARYGCEAITRSKSARTGALPGAYAIEKQPVVVAIDHQHDRALVDGIARRLADLRRPVLRQESLQVGDLPLELARGASRERELMPHEAARRGEGIGPQPRRFRVVHVRHHQHGGRMLVEPVRHLLQREADVLQADLLADDVEGDVGEAVVHRAHEAREDGAIARARVEHPHRGGRGLMFASSASMRCATIHFSVQVLTNSKYFCRLS
jgi:hypothetical protein